MGQDSESPKPKTCSGLLWDEGFQALVICGFNVFKGFGLNGCERLLGAKEQPE